MTWYYSDGEKQLGPVTEEQLIELRRSGIVTSDTLIWREGMANWASYSAAGPAVNLDAAPPATTAPPVMPVPPLVQPGGSEAVCAECGRIFPKDEMITHGQSYVCVNCKPVFVQKLSEGVIVRSTAGATGFVSEEQLLAREYVIDIGGALQKSWDIFTGNPGLNIAAVVVIGLCFAAGWLLSNVVGLVVPMANSLLSLLYSVPLAAGLLWYFLRQARNQPVTLGDAFAGFTMRYGQLLLFGLVQFLFTVLCLLPVIAVGVGFVISTGGVHRSGPSQFGPILIVLIAITGLIGLMGVVYVATIFSFAPLLILDKGYRFWPAIQLSRKAVSRGWWMTFLFQLVAGIIQIAGLLLCLVGGLASVPVYYGMKSVLYDDNFRDLAPRS